MKSRSYKLVIAGAIAVLAGCSSGGTPSVPAFSPSGAQINERVEAKKKKPTETLKAKRVTVKVQSCISGTGQATAVAKGKAKGRYHGKLSVTAAWDVYGVGGGQFFWVFGETFKIKGKHPITGTITGTGTDAIATCKTFGPVKNAKDLTYHLGTKTGSATMPVIKNGAPLLQQLH